MALKAHEHPIKKVFSSDYDFVIPHYQRPYAWGTEQALQLLDDLEDAMARPNNEPYFLGSLVLVKPKEEAPSADVIDGQQRLTTLSILFAVLRDLTDDETTRTTMRDMVMEPGIPLDNILAKPRLRLREQDAAFFKARVQTPGKIGTLVGLSAQALDTDSQRAIRDNARALHERLSDWSETQRAKLAGMVRNETFLVVVSTPEIASAHRIFSVMNARGLDLSPADIFKSMVIGSLPEAEQSAYAAKWETAEQDLGRDNFADLFLHIRVIFNKTRGRRELLVEFPEQVLDEYIDKQQGAEFVDDVLLPYASAHGHALNQDFDPHDAAWVKVNAWLKRLAQLDNNDWRPAAMWALKHHPDDPDFLDAFLRKLERLAASMLLCRVYATPRVGRYLDLLKELDEDGLGLDAPAFELTPAEKAYTLTKLREDVYKVVAVRKFVLLRLDELLAQQPGVSYQHQIITVEHVLPQTPAANGSWVKLFNESEREQWTHKLGNLLLLNRNRNSAAQNYDFEKKKTKYFTDSHGVAAFAITTPVIGMPEWTPQVVSDRQEQLVGKLRAEWELG